MSAQRTIRQNHPGASVDACRGEIESALRRVVGSGWYVHGGECAAFESEFARFVGAEASGHSAENSGCWEAVGVGNGTDALALALEACGVGRGHAVVTVSHTAVATVAAIVMTGAQPVFADIDPRTMTMSPESLEETVIRHRRAGRAGGAELKAVVVVHLYGHPARMDAILRVAERHGLEVVEDCAQSHGAAWMGRQTGTWGRAAAFSFYPTKNLGALGDGGAVVTRDGELAERVRLLREYGWRERYVSEVSGRNSRLDELQAAVLRVRLRYLERENGMRCRLAQAYDQALQGAGVRLPQSLGEARHVFHQYVIRTAHRDALRDALQRCGVGTLIHYPVPIHLQPAYRGVARGEALPETEAAAGEVLSLPMFPQLRLEEVDFVAEQIRAIVAAWTSG